MKKLLKKDVNAYDLKSGEGYTLFQGSVVEVQSFCEFSNAGLSCKTKSALELNAKRLFWNIANTNDNQSISAKKILSNVYSLYNIDLFNLSWNDVRKYFLDMPVVILYDRTNNRHLVIDFNVLVYEPSNFLEIKFGGCFLQHLISDCFEQIFDNVFAIVASKYKYKANNRPLFTASTNHGCFFGYKGIDDRGNVQVIRGKKSFAEVFNDFTAASIVFDQSL